jgi:hypothetical protein
VPNSVWHLLANDRDRAALADEPEEVRPEVPFVGMAFALAGRREGLAGTRPGPEGAFVGPAGEPGGEGPPGDAGEEVAGLVSHKVACTNFGDVAFIDFPARDQLLGDEDAQPRGRVPVEFVVIVGPHQKASVVGAVETRPAARSA